MHLYSQYYHNIWDKFIIIIIITSSSCLWPASNTRGLKSAKSPFALSVFLEASPDNCRLRVAGGYNNNVSCSEFRLTYLHMVSVFSVWTTTKMHNCQGYFSRTIQDISFNFQDFLGPGIFKKKSRTFQEVWEAGFKPILVCHRSCHLH